MKRFRPLSVIIILIFAGTNLYGQNFTPVSVTGFNYDCIAEGGPSSLATTTKEMDALASNKVMYSDAFRVFGGLAGGGLPDNGSIVNGNMTFQLANYASNNALFVYRNETKSLNLAVPSTFTKIRVLCFATEANGIGGSLVNISLTFTDATTVQYITNYNLDDWFNGATNNVLTGFGRCSRVASAPWGEEGFPTNPRMYYIEIVLSCNDSQKQLQSLNFSNITSAGANAPFPNQVFMGVSGISYSTNITTSSIPCDCSGPTGAATVTATGNSAPYTYSWNTIPVQTTATATGLTPGTYTCTITDVNGCIQTQQVTVILFYDAILVVNANPTMCLGTSSQLTANFQNAFQPTYTWTPGNLTGPSITVAPAVTTTYTVVASNAIGCTASAQVTLTVLPFGLFIFGNDITVCSGSTGTLQALPVFPGITFKWYDAPTGGTLLGTGNSYTTAPMSTTTIFYVEAVTPINCTSLRKAFTVTVTNLPAAPVVNGITICSGTNATLNVSGPQPGFTYSWYDAATGGTLLFTGTSYTLNNVTVPTTVYVQSTNNSGCNSATRTAVTVDVYAPLATPIVTVSNVTTNSVTFSWAIVSGATGYEVSTNGGVSFQAPSSGTTGTQHTISGLSPLQTVSIIVRALGTPACRNSQPSAITTATTKGTTEVFVPNVFTPNNDGRNDILYVYGNFIASMTFRIFNQWGEMIFVSTDKNTGWNGYYKNILQPVGVYAYTLVAILNDGTTVKKQGSINLIR